MIRWYNLIGGSLSKICNFRFVLPKEWKKCQDKIQSMARNVLTLEIRNMTIDDMKICEVLKKFDFKVLILDDVVIDAQIFKRLLDMFLLDELIVKGSSVVEMGQYEKTYTYSSTVLSVLVLASVNMTLFETLTEINLPCMKLAYKIDDHSDNSFYSWHMYPFVEFMAQQTCLKEMIVSLPASERVFSHLVDQLKSKRLQKLVIHLKTGTYNPEKFDGLTQLLTSQPNLKELEIYSETISADAIIVIYKITGLQTLKLKIGRFPLITQAICQPQTNVKRLIVSSDGSFPPDLLDDMLKVFKNVETLGVIYRMDETYSNEIVLCAQQRLKSLKYLKAPLIGNNFPAIAFSSLRKLQVNLLSSKAGLRTFLSQNPLLQELEIESMSNKDDNKMIDEILIEIPPESVNMKKLTLSSVTKDFEIDENVLRTLKASCPSLMRIAVRNDIGVSEKIVDYSSIKVAKFNKCSKYDVFEKFTGFSFDDETIKTILWHKEESKDDD